MVLGVQVWICFVWGLLLGGFGLLVWVVMGWICWCFVGLVFYFWLTVYDGYYIDVRCWFWVLRFGVLFDLCFEWLWLDAIVRMCVGVGCLLWGCYLVLLGFGLVGGCFWVGCWLGWVDWIGCVHWALWMFGVGCVICLDLLFGCVGLLGVLFGLL